MRIACACACAHACIASENHEALVWVIDLN